MAEFQFTIGADVYARDGRCGVMRKVVIDPATRRVTDLVVEKGFLQKEDRVLPVSIVERVTTEEIHLSIRSEELENYPLYREEEFIGPAPGWQGDWQYQQEEILHWLTYYGLPDYPEPIIPMIRQRVPRGIPSELEVIGRDTPVRNMDGMVGKVDHLLVNQQSWEITHLVVRKGMLPYRLVIPISWIKHIDEHGVFIQGNKEQLREAPRHIERSPIDILTEIRERLNQAVYDFRDVIVSLENGIVRLRGTVEGTAAKRHAEQSVRSVQGVLDVENQLDTNSALAARVTAALASDPRTHLAVIEVISDRGVITLNGRVKDAETRQAAEEIASEQPGVVAVINGLEVEPSEEGELWPGPAVAAPYILPWKHG
ncbi:MAG TPA: BON domain-containing protein [Caldilineaceae bacterium]|nr:BON domain-containing protein [Caldilineaceae bacterium]